MEPCWMALGQAAGAAASLAVDSGCAVQDIDVKCLQEVLLNHGATLFYMEDVSVSDPDYKAFTILGLEGYIPGWEALPDDQVSEADLKLWSSLAPGSLDGVPSGSRREALRWIYRKYYLTAE